MNARKVHILLVDDDPGDCRLVKLVLAKSPQAMEFTVETAESLAEALRCLDSHNLDLVLLDLALPDSRGLKTVDEVCGLYPQIPVVVLTVLADETMGLRAIKMGASDYLVKGKYSHELLLRTIRYSLERKRTEQELKQQQKNLQAIFDAAPVAMLLIDENTVVTKINDAATKVVGKSPLEMTNRQPGESFSCIHLSDDPRGCGYGPHCSSCPIRSTFEQVFSSGQAVHGVECQPTLLIGQKKVTLWLELSAVPVNVEGNRHVIVAISNITDRKLAEEQIAIFRRFAESSGQGLAMATLKGEITYANPTLCRVLGEDGPENVLGKTFIAYYSEELQSRLKNEILPTVMREGQWVGELALLSTDGRITHTVENIFLIRDEKGEPLCMADIMTEITDRKRAEEALSISEANLQRAQEVARIGSWHVDLMKDELSWSDEIYMIFGVGPDESSLTYEKFLEIIHPDDRAHVDKAWKAALAGGAYDVEHRIVVDGQIRWIREKAEIEFSKEGKPIFGTGVAQDITDRKQADDNIRNLAKFPSENPNPVMRISGDGGILYANAASRSLLEARGAKEGKQVPQSWLEWVKETFRSAKACTFDFECNSRVLSITLAHVAGTDYANAYALDISERKKAEAEVNKSMDELQRFNKLAVGRELRMIELKKEVNEMAGKAGVDPPYNLAFVQADEECHDHV